MAARKGLGRGLGALIQEKEKVTPLPPPPVATPAAPTGNPLSVSITSIAANTLQPRHTFSEDALTELSASIREHGILQPLTVRTASNGYELIAGERRLRAAGLAGLTEVPVLIREVTDAVSLELALIENLQREDLNVIEEAEGYHELAEKFELTQEQIAERMGKGRASIANALRLLSLGDEVKAMLSDRRLASGHAKVLLGVTNEKDQVILARRTVREGLTVRALERIVEAEKKSRKKRKAAKSDLPASHINDITDQLHVYFGTSVRVAPCKTFANGKKGKGTIEIDYFSNDDLDRVLCLLNLADGGDELD
jgi:ParB family chromosome partitioning protein